MACWASCWEIQHGKAPILKRLCNVWNVWTSQKKKCLSVKTKNTEWKFFHSASPFQMFSWSSLCLEKVLCVTISCQDFNQSLGLISFENSSHLPVTLYLMQWQHLSSCQWTWGLMCFQIHVESHWPKRCCPAALSCSWRCHTAAKCLFVEQMPKEEPSHGPKKCFFDTFVQRKWNNATRLRLFECWMKWQTSWFLFWQGRSISLNLRCYHNAQGWKALGCFCSSLFYQTVSIKGPESLHVVMPAWRCWVFEQYHLKRLHLFNKNKA